MPCCGGRDAQQPSEIRRQISNRQDSFATGLDRQSELALLFHQEHRAAALDFASYFAVHVGRHAGNTARQNFAAFRNEFFQKIGIFVIDRFNGNVDPAPRHGAVSAAKGRTAFGGFGLHRKLSCLAVQRAPL
jgi:hypothetical protein